MPRKPIKAENPTDVDIDLAAAAFMAGRAIGEMKVDGEAILQMFMGAVTETRPETDNFQAHRYMARALMKAEGRRDET